MWDGGDRHYYVNELCRLKNGRFVIPIRWLAKTHGDGSKTIHADAFNVTFDETVCLVLMINIWLTFRQYSLSQPFTTMM
jgi:hypothetical protein